MKKLLSATLAVAMGATCVWSLAACNTGDKDAETAQAAINTIKTLYDKTDYANTTSSFTVLGKTSVGDDLYDVTWTVSTDSTAVNDITDYIKIGTELDDDYLITVTVTRPEVDVEYKLTATVTVGKETASYTFTRTLVALKESDIYTVAKMLAIDQSKYVEVKSGTGNNIKTNKYYSEDGTTAAVITVRGYVVETGSWSSQYSNFTGVYIADEFTGEQNKDSEGVAQIYRVKTDDVYVKGESDLQKGDLVTFQGCIQFYYEEVEMTYCGDVNVTCIGLVRDTSDAGKVKAAKASVSLADSYEASEVTLPTTLCGASLSWQVTSGTNATINGSTMTISNPEADTTVKVTVTISSGSVTDTKEISFQVLKTSSKGTLADPYTVAELKALTIEKGKYLSVNNVAKAVYVTGYVVETGSWSGGNYNNYTGVYLVDVFASDKTGSSADAIQLYRLGSDAQYITGADSLRKGDKITVLGYIQNYNGTIQITYSGSTNPTAVAKENASDETIIANALAAVKAKLDDVDAAGNVTLPAPTEKGVTFGWVVTEGSSVATVTGNDTDGYKLAVTLPTENTPVKLTLTANYNGKSNTKEVTLTVIAPSDDAIKGTLNLATNFGTYASDWGNSYGSQTVTFTAIGVTDLVGTTEASDISGTVAFSRVSKQSNTIADRPVMAANAKDDTAPTVYVTVTLDNGKGAISAVEFDLAQWSSSKKFSDIHIEYTTDGTTWTSCGEGSTTLPTTVKSSGIPEGVTQVRLSITTTTTSNTQIGISSIKLTVTPPAEA